VFKKAKLVDFAKFALRFKKPGEIILSGESGIKSLPSKTRQKHE
jgi:hypothetical protein